MNIQKLAIVNEDGLFVGLFRKEGPENESLFFTSEINYPEVLLLSNNHHGREKLESLLSFCNGGPGSWFNKLYNCKIVVVTISYDYK